MPRAFDVGEIPAVVEAFRQGAENPRLAGFDGVEIHGANDYLLDQFPQDASNKRTDRYGGEVENRARLLLEVTDAVIGIWGAGRVGMHLAPRGDAHSMGDSNPAATFGCVALALGERKIAFLCAREHAAPDALGPELKKQFGGAYVVNEGYTPQSAEEAIERGEADAVAFGKAFIANLDLVERIRRGAPLNEAAPPTFYAQGPNGYTDYPTLST
jgi:2,4-dienoyl-CoA reductase-like NADH-dependent reductase (Old Yellow Enzyme family)